MPKNVVEYRVFVASPSDVQEERSLLEDVVNELNLTIPKQYNIKLELVKWETHIYPGFADDGQDVINKQLNGDYDIFIGIMHGRFGSQTPRFESGTYEEFSIAYEKWKENPSSVSIMFYFKTAPLDIYKADIKQVEKVKFFYNELCKEKGGLISTFETSAQFSQLLRIHLSNLISDLQAKDASGEKLLKSNLELVVNENIDEIGLYESIDLIEENMLEVTSSLFKMSTYLNELTDKITLRTTQLNRLSGTSAEIRQREIRRINDLLADDYFTYANKINEELPIYSSKFSDASKYLSNAYEIYIEWQSSYDSELINSCIGLVKAIEETKIKMLGFSQTIKSLPNLTTKVIKGKKELISSHHKIDSEFKFSIQLLNGIIDKKIS